MGTASGRTTGWGVALRAAPLAFFFVLASVGEAAAGTLRGSRHDFSATGPEGKLAIDTRGICSPCHIPHGSEGNFRLWTRSLSDETAAGKYVQTSTPNYLHHATLLCYDCHDDASWADGTSSDQPDPTVWKDALHKPQDIALGGHNNSTVGYYELIDGKVPNDGTPPTDGSPTGGHYWKVDTNGTQKKGDKIACFFCHDPHNKETGSNMVFFRKTAVDGQDLGDNHDASENTRAGLEQLVPPSNGRSMCVACHAYSDTGTPKIFFNVNLAVLDRPPATIAAHSSSDSSTACTNCHKHNKIKASCIDCHGNPPTSGAHQSHVAYLGAASCGSCHGDNPGGAAWHNNGSVDWTSGLIYSQAGPGRPLPTDGTCSGTACHDAGATNNIAWNAAPTNCTQCHLNAADTDANDFNGSNNVASRIDSSEYTAVGHAAAGKVCLDCHDLTALHDTSSTLSGGTNPFRLKDQDGGTTGVQFSCSYNTGDCHSGYQSITNHSAAAMSAAGYNPKYDGLGSAGWDAFTPNCVNCHDPHGDGANLSMIQKELYDKAVFNLPTQAPPAAPTEQTNLSFTDNTAGVHNNGSSYADGDDPFSSVCQECHEGTAGTNTTYAFVDGVSATAGSHTMSTDCSACHKHDSGFKPSGCSGCHGGGTTGTPTSVRNYWPDGSSGNAENMPAQNKHFKHVQELALRLCGETTTQLLTDNSGSSFGCGALTSEVKQKRVCAYCHEDPAGNYFAGPTQFYHANGTTNVTTPSVFVRQLWQTYAVDFATADTNAAYDAAADTCATVDCHNNKLTTDGTYGWYDDGTSACTMCHTPGGATQDPISGLHDNSPSEPTVSGVAHDDSFGPNNSTCTYCHATMPSRTTTSTHVNGSFDANGTVVGNRTSMGLFADYTAVSTASNGTGTCSGGTSAGQVGATGCHDKGDGGTWKREWDSGISYDTLASLNPCKGCHGAAAADFTFGTVHNAGDGQTEHTYDWDGNNGSELFDTSTHSGCKTCHGVNSATDYQASYTVGADFWRGQDGTSMHGDGSIQMNGPEPATGTGYDQTNWGCSNATACHPNDWAGSYPTGTGHRLDDSNWDVSTVNFGSASCTTCHGYPPTGANDGGTNWNLHAAGTQAVKHDSIDSGDTTELKANHNECGYCHGVKANATLDGFVVQDPAALNGAYTYVPVTDHKNGSVTMNGGGTASDAAYSLNTGGCANAACHPDDNSHQIDPVSGSMPTTSSVSARQIGPGLCSYCHGGGQSLYGYENAWPDGMAPNGGNNYPNRIGEHQRHVNWIYVQHQNSTILAGTTEIDEKNDTCKWCHPGNPPVNHPTDTVTGSEQGEVDRMDTAGNGFQGTPRGADDYWYYTNGAAATSGSTAAYFKDQDGTPDTDAYLSIQVSTLYRTCLNLSCHNGSETNDWYGGVDLRAPTLSAAPAASPNPTQQGTASVTLTATCSDVATGNKKILAAEYFWPAEGTGGTGEPMSALDGAFDEPEEAVTAVVDSSSWPTNTNLYVDCKDEGGNWGPATAGRTTVTLTAKDDFSVALTQAGPTEDLPLGAQKNTVMAFTFTDASGGSSVQVQGLTITGTKSSGTGNVYDDVSLVGIYHDNGSTANSWDGTDTLIGSGTFNTSNVAAIDITDQTITSPTAVRMLLVYDISSAATVHDVIGGNLTAVSHPGTDNLTGTLPVASGNVKGIGDNTKPGVTVTKVEFLNLKGQLQTFNAPFQPGQPNFIQNDTTTITVTATAADSGIVISTIAAAEYSLIQGNMGGGGTSIPAPYDYPDVPDQYDETTEVLKFTVDTTGWTYASSPYRVYVDCKDDAGNWGPTGGTWVTIYVDPEQVGGGS